MGASTTASSNDDQQPPPTSSMETTNGGISQSQPEGQSPPPSGLEPPNLSGTKSRHPISNTTSSENELFDNNSATENNSSTNPIYYSSSNPRSVKNMSYIDTNFEKLDMSPALSKRMVRRKPKSLSVEDRIQSLKDSEEDK